MKKLSDFIVTDFHAEKAAVGVKIQLIYLVKENGDFVSKTFSVNMTIGEYYRLTKQDHAAFALDLQIMLRNYEKGLKNE